MSAHGTTWLARGLFAATILFAVPAFVMAFFSPAWSSEDLLFVTVGMVLMGGYGSVGALIASRHPRNPIGWLLLAIGFIFAMNALCDEYVTRAYLVGTGSLPLSTLAAWLNSWTFAIAIGAIPLALLLFPTGRPPSARWRAVAWMLGVGVLGPIGLAISTNPLQSREGVKIANPIGIDGPVPPILMTVGGIAALFGALGCVVALVVRFRRSRGDERQQLRWLAYAGAAAGLTLATTLVFDVIGVDDAGHVGDWLFTAFFVVIGVGVPAACGVAILKYRLYELDVVVKKAVVFAILAGFVALAYVAVAGAIGLLIGGSGSTPTVFVLAFVLGVLFGPVRRWAQQLADRVVYGRRASPYEILSRFTRQVGGSYAADDVLARMARILAEGTGARSAGVWLHVGSELRPAAGWPVEEHARNAVAVRGDALPPLPDEEQAFEVRDDAQLLGALSLSMPPNDPMDPARERLARDLASQAGLVLKNVRLIEELRASRQRLVAAQDEERRRLERNIHDGAQQQLVALGVRMRLLDALIERDPARARELVGQLQIDTTQAIDDLRDLARGIYPPLLADQGLTAALEAQARKASMPVRVDPDGVGRYSREVEASVYFCVLEALQNVAKYARATHVEVELRQEDGRLAFEVRDDGVGFEPANAPRGSGLQGMADRIEAIGGTFEIRSAPGAGTAVVARVPLGADPPPARTS